MRDSSSADLDLLFNAFEEIRDVYPPKTAAGKYVMCVYFPEYSNPCRIRDHFAKATT